MKKKPGPTPQVLKIAGEWKDAVRRMLTGAGAVAPPKAKKAKTKKRKGK